MGWSVGDRRPCIYVPSKGGPIMALVMHKM